MTAERHSTRNTASERAVRIELARMRAALEREAVARDACKLAGALRPSAILHSMVPRAGSRSVVDWLLRAVALTRRYPLLTSAASALLSGVGRGRGRQRWLWRVGAGLLIAWQVARKHGEHNAPGRHDIDLPKGRER
ncbi:hypothetical protein [Paracandidimonas lactea]|uniref:hypothetical protein n=1 Tax=Paracandidimonas lactea TaxID=2895524 RepID=UPI0019295215|nr:hypothetical protein [Paracandidimonas lactea]